MVKRNYGIDLLRLLLMLMVVMLHTLGNGGVLRAVELHSANYFLAWTIECLCYCAVNCYALITGYVSYGRPYRINSVIMIWLQAILYTLVITALAWMFGDWHFSISYFLNAFLLPSSNPLWYVPVYTGVYVFIPVINTAVKSLSWKQTKYFLAVSFCALTVVPTFFLVDPFAQSGGYSVLWIGYLYFVGSVIKKYELDKRISARHAGWVYLISALILIASKFGPSLVTTLIWGEPRFDDILLNYTSPVMPIIAAAMLVIFINLRLTPKICKIIKVLSPAAFGVYLIHCQPYLFMKCHNLYAFLADYSVLKMVFGSVGISLLIFAFCLAVDLCRIALFKKLKIRDFVCMMEEKYLSCLKCFD